MADWDFLKNIERDSYGDNLLPVGDAEPGVLTGWTTSGVSTIVGGVGNYGDYAFELSPGSYMYYDATPNFTPPDIEVYGFFFSAEVLTNPAVKAGITVNVFYTDGTFDTHLLPTRTSLDTKYPGNVFIPAEQEIYWHLVREVIPINTEKTIGRIFFNAYNAEDSITVYADNLSLRLNNNVPVARGAYNDEAMIDKYGINPVYLDYFKNMVYNSSFERYDDATPTIPDYWDGTGELDNNSNFYGTYSCRLDAGCYIETASDAYINPSFYENELTRVSFYRKLGIMKLQVYDITNADYFTLTDTDGNSGTYLAFSATSNWQNSVTSAQFDPTEHGSCTAYKVIITNIHGSQAGYIDAVMVQPDFTGKWPQIYKDGPNSSDQQIIVSDTAPTDTTKLWLDTTGLWPEPAPTDFTLLYTFGGADASGRTAGCDEYDPDTWTAKTNMPSAYSSINGAPIGTKFYAFGGYEGAPTYGAVTDNNEFDANVWTAKTGLTLAVYDHAGCGVDSKAYSFGGNIGGSVDGKETEEYISDAWTSKTDMPTPGRWSFPAVEEDGAAYLLGGITTGGNYLTDFDSYDPDTWTSLTAISPQAASKSAFAISSKVYGVGGTYYSGGTINLTDTDEYDISGASWSAKTDLGSTRYGAAGGSIDGKGYIALGTLGGSRSDATDEYDATGDTWTSKTAMGTATDSGPGYSGL